MEKLAAETKEQMAQKRVPGTPVSVSSHKTEYGRFQHRFQTKKMAVLHKHLAEKYNDKAKRGQLFQDWMDVEGNLAALTFVQCKRLVTTTRATTTMAAKLESELNARYNDVEYVAMVMANARARGRALVDPLKPLDTSKVQYIVPWEIEVAKDVAFQEEMELSAKGHPFLDSRNREA